MVQSRISRCAAARLTCTGSPIASQPTATFKPSLAAAIVLALGVMGIGLGYFISMSPLACNSAQTQPASGLAPCPGLQLPYGLLGGILHTQTIGNVSGPCTRRISAADNRSRFNTGRSMAWIVITCVHFDAHSPLTGINSLVRQHHADAKQHCNAYQTRPQSRFALGPVRQAMRSSASSSNPAATLARWPRKATPSATSTAPSPINGVGSRHRPRISAPHPFPFTVSVVLVVYPLCSHRIGCSWLHRLQHHQHGQ